MDAVFRALADSTRRELLDRLYREGGLTLGKLCEGMEMSRQAVSKHLAILKQANLVVVLPHGRERRHYLNPVPIYEIFERWIGKYDRSRLEALSDLRRALEGDSDERKV
ncbi:ArsR/SmtB family transcription factor [Fimbriimonas ginsengisoli]|uniref:Transcriptional regulator n=1 Tax=Fimbriimonas ginsengisoli Gsoil 348 TaxID=661478 RepID=A0A068NVB8_FIMGI|nr:metalloregulator ArsR/SmtB family transcription factor [Fimbriimonas ginsengisoli]AIE87317.1 transcriptional regulator [Fimbriimonas ginsengisoli Gsoil 348]